MTEDTGLSAAHRITLMALLVPAILLVIEAESLTCGAPQSHQTDQATTLVVAVVEEIRTMIGQAAATIPPDHGIAQGAMTP